MSQQVIDAIKQKYGVSDQTAQQVVNALVQVEQHRQASTQGMRSIGQTPDIMSIVGGLLGGQGQNSAGGELMGLVGGLLGGQQQGNQGNELAGLLGGLLGGGQPQGGHNMVSILGDLLGGATHPSQAPDLTSIVGGLLGGGQGGNELNGLVNGLLGGGGGQSAFNPAAQQPMHQQPSQPPIIHKEGPEKKMSDHPELFQQHEQHKDNPN